MAPPPHRLSGLQETVDGDEGRRRYSTRQRNHSGSTGTVRRLTQSYEARREAVSSPVRGSGLAKLSVVQSPPTALPAAVETYPPGDGGSGKTHPLDGPGKAHPPGDGGSEKTHPLDGPGKTHPPGDSGTDKTHPPLDNGPGKLSEVKSQGCSAQEGCDQSLEGRDQAENPGRDKAEGVEAEGEGTREGEVVSNGEREGEVVSNGETKEGEGVTDGEREGEGVKNGEGEGEGVKNDGDVEGPGADKAAVNGEVGEGGEGSMEVSGGHDGGDQGPSTGTPDRYHTLLCTVGSVLSSISLVPRLYVSASDVRSRDIKAWGAWGRD